MVPRDLPEAEQIWSAPLDFISDEVFDALRSAAQPNDMIHGGPIDSQQTRHSSLGTKDFLDHQVALNSLAPLGQLDIVSGKHDEWHTKRNRFALSSKKSRNSDIQEKTALGARIRVARGDRPQSWLASGLGQRHTAISQWERGVRTPKPTTLVQIAQATGCDLAWLLRGDYQVRTLPSPAAAETPSLWPKVPQELQGDPRLERAAQDLIYLLQHGEAEELTAILKNIEVFARDTRARLEPKRRRRAG